MPLEQDELIGQSVVDDVLRGAKVVAEVEGVEAEMLEEGVREDDCRRQQAAKSAH